MKFGFKIKGIQFGEVNIGEIEVNTELSMAEVIGMRKESEYLLENLPKYMEQVKEVIDLDKSMTIRDFNYKPTDLSEKARAESILEKFKSKIVE